MWKNSRSNYNLRDLKHIITAIEGICCRFGQIPEAFEYIRLTNLGDVAKRDGQNIRTYTKFGSFFVLVWMHMRNSELG